MELVFRIALFIAGMINFIPSLLAFLPSKISKSYNVEIKDANMELLLRHRAVMFGIIGGFMIYASAMKVYYGIASAIGLISMVSFLILFFLIKGEINKELRKVARIDLLAITLLVIGLILFQLV